MMLSCEHHGKNHVNPWIIGEEPEWLLARKGEVFGFQRVCVLLRADLREKLEDSRKFTAKTQVSR